MTPDECRAIAGRVRETLAWARYVAGRGAAVQAMAAELTVIADDLCSRARAERERARELASGQVATHRRNIGNAGADETRLRQRTGGCWRGAGHVHSDGLA